MTITCQTNFVKTFAARRIPPEETAIGNTCDTGRKHPQFLCCWTDRGFHQNFRYSAVAVAIREHISRSRPISWQLSLFFYIYIYIYRSGSQLAFSVSGRMRESFSIDGYVQPFVLVEYAIKKCILLDVIYVYIVESRTTRIDCGHFCAARARDVSVEASAFGASLFKFSLPRMSCFHFIDSKVSSSVIFVQPPFFFE